MLLKSYMQRVQMGRATNGKGFNREGGERATEEIMQNGKSYKWEGLHPIEKRE